MLSKLPFFKIWLIHSKVQKFGTNPNKKTYVFYLPRARVSGHILPSHGQEFQDFYYEPYYAGDGPEGNVAISRFILRTINDNEPVSISYSGDQCRAEYHVSCNPDHNLVIVYNWQTRIIFNAYPKY